MWPCDGDTYEKAESAFRFWTELLRLALRLGDEKMIAYAQDTLVGALSSENWARMLQFAEQVECRMLLEAALMMGIRLLLPALLRSFNVQTGLEGTAQGDTAGAGAGAKDSGTSGFVGQTLGGSQGSVELELEQHLQELRPTSGALAGVPEALRSLRRGSPAQYAELKQRLVYDITSAQRAGSQLRRCAQFFDSHEKAGFHREETASRTFWMELVVLALFMLLFVLPAGPRTRAMDYALYLFRQLHAWSSSVPFVDLVWINELTSGVHRVMFINAVVVLGLCIAIWQSLKN